MAIALSHGGPTIYSSNGKSDAEALPAFTNVIVMSFDELTATVPKFTSFVLTSTETYAPPEMTLKYAPPVVAVCPFWLSTVTK